MGISASGLASLNRKGSSKDWTVARIVFSKNSNQAGLRWFSVCYDAAEAQI
jgi:hypothetical protein